MKEKKGRENERERKFLRQVFFRENFSIPKVGKNKKERKIDDEKKRKRISIHFHFLSFLSLLPSSFTLLFSFSSSFLFLSFPSFSTLHSSLTRNFPSRPANFSQPKIAIAFSFYSSFFLSQFFLFSISFNFFSFFSFHTFFSPSLCIEEVMN